MLLAVNSFKFQSCDHTPPGARLWVSRWEGPTGYSLALRRISGRHRLGSELRWYLITFGPPTLVPDRNRTHLADAFASAGPPGILKFHLWPQGYPRPRLVSVRLRRRDGQARPAAPIDLVP